MSKVRVRVEARKGASKADTVNLLRAFKRLCKNYGIPRALKDHEFYIRPADKRRRKKMQKPQDNDNKEIF